MKFNDRIAEKYLGGKKLPKPVAINENADFDALFATFQKNIIDINKTLVDPNWKGRLGEIDAAYQSDLMAKSDKMANLAMKLNAVSSDFSKSYFNSVNSANSNEPGKKLDRLNGKQPDDASGKVADVSANASTPDITPEA